MTVQPPQQFSPDQILDAAHRAESEGRLDFASQFYHHLLDYYPSSVEAAAAREGLARLSQGEGGRTDHLDNRDQLEHRDHLPANAVRRTAASHAPLPAPHMQNPAHDRHAPPAHAPRRRAQTGSAHEHDRRRHPLEHSPARRHDYLSGRILARLLTWSGGLTTLAGAALTPVSLAMPDLLAIVPFVGLYIALPGAGLGLVMAGLAMMLIGQLARAVLDMANATRDVAASRLSDSERRAGPGSTSGSGSGSGSGDRNGRHLRD